MVSFFRSTAKAAKRASGAVYGIVSPNIQIARAYSEGHRALGKVLDSRKVSEFGDAVKPGTVSTAIETQRGKFLGEVYETGREGYQSYLAQQGGFQDAGRMASHAKRFGQTIGRHTKQNQTMTWREYDIAAGEQAVKMNHFLANDSLVDGVDKWVHATLKNIDTIGKLAVKHKILPEESYLKFTADGRPHFPQMFSQTKISSATPNDVLDFFIRLQESNMAANLGPKIAVAQKNLATAIATNQSDIRIDKMRIALETLEGMPELEAKKFLNDLVAGRYGTTGTALEDDMFARVMERTLDIPDDMVPESMLYLETSLSKVYENYVNQMIPRIQLAKKDLLGAGWDKKIADLKKEYGESRLLEDDLKKRAFMDRDFNRSVRLNTAMKDRAIGRYGLPDNPEGVVHRVNTGLLGLGSVIHLGKVALSSLPDPALIVSHLGVKRTAKVMSRYIFNKEFRDISKQEAKQAAGIYEMMLHQQSRTMAELGLEDMPITSGFESGIQKMVGTLARVTLMDRWNQLMKTITVMGSMDMMIGTAQRLARGLDIDDLDLKRLREMGISDQDLFEINSYYTRYGAKSSGGVKFAQTNDWITSENIDWVEKVQNGLRYAADKIIVTPSIGSRPLSASTVLGRHMLKFKAFSLTSTTSIVESGLHYRDQRILSGAVMAITLGTASYAMKRVADGKEVSSDPFVLFLEGVDRSGILGILGEIHTISNRMSGGYWGLDPRTGSDVSSARWAAQSNLEALLGPTAGLIKNSLNVAGGVATGNIDKSTISSGRHIIPYQSLFYASWLFGFFEEGLTKAFVEEED